MFSPLIKITHLSNFDGMPRKILLLICLNVPLLSLAQTNNPLATLTELDEQNRYQTLSELVRGHDFDCVAENEQYVIGASKDSSYRVRNQAVMLLSHCKTSSNANANAQRLVEMLKSPSERSQVKDTVITAIGGMGELSPEIKQLLLDYARNSNGAIRREDATLSIASYGVVDDDVLEAIFVLMDAERASSRVVALQCLQLLTTPLNKNTDLAKTVLERVFSKLPNEKVNFNQHAMLLTAELGQHSDQSIAVLIDMLNNAKFSRKAAAHALVQMGSPAKQALATLQNVAQQSSGFEQKTLLQAIQDIEKI